MIQSSLKFSSPFLFYFLNNRFKIFKATRNVSKNVFSLIAIFINCCVELNVQSETPKIIPVRAKMREQRISSIPANVKSINYLKTQFLVVLNNEI